MDNAEDGTLAQFPGQSAVSKNLENSRGIAATYTTIISDSKINVVSYGLTRLGTQSSGVGGSSVSFSTSQLAGVSKGQRAYQPDSQPGR